MRACIPTAIIVVALLFSACGGTQKSFDPGPRGTIRFKGDPPDANLEIDETRLGTIDMFKKNGVFLRPGDHRIVVKKEGFFPEYRIIKVIKDQVKLIEIKLRPIPQ